MTKKTLTLIAVLAASAAPIAHAEPPEESTTYTVVLAGGSAQNMIHIWLTPDGTEYVIDSVVPLEVGGDVCHNASGSQNELLCQAPLVAGFVVVAGPGDDRVSVAGTVQVPTTLNGGPGNDVLRGGGGDDRIVGGPGNDVLSGGAANDAIFGGPGNDVLNGGPGNDVLNGGPGNDVLRGGPGRDVIHPGPGRHGEGEGTPHPIKR
jgi:Ca2+-binding RTX toxin-like protein